MQVERLKDDYFLGKDWVDLKVYLGFGSAAFRRRNDLKNRHMFEHSR